MRMRIPLASCLLATIAVAQNPAPLGPDLPQLLHAVAAKDPRLGQWNTVRRSRAVAIDLDLLAAAEPDSVCRVTLFEDTAFLARFEKREDHGPGRYTWIGSLDGRRYSMFVISVDGEAVSGSFTPASRDHPYMIELQPGPGLHFVREIEQTSKNAPIAPPPFRAPASGGSCNDDPTKIRLMVCYSAGALRAAGNSTSRIRSWITSQVGYLNAVMSDRNSKVGMQFLLTSVRYVPYTSQTDMCSELTRLRLKSDGHMDQVHGWRDSEKADLVALILAHDRAKHGNTTGKAYAPPSLGLLREELGFSITAYGQPSNVFTQEVCHNFGCHHDPANAPKDRIFPYAQAHKNYKDTGFPFYNATNFTTVVGYPNSRHPIVPDLSWPNHRFRRTYTIGPDGPWLWLGTAAANDNRRTILQVRQKIANYRYSDRKSPIITLHPRNASRCLGHQEGSAVTVMTAGAAYAASFQWRRNGVDISGQTSPFLRFTTLTAADAGSYDCVVTGSCPLDKVTTRPATLTLGPCRVQRIAAPVDSGVAPIGDFDRDGYQDFATARVGHSSGISGVVWYSGKEGKFLGGFQFSGNEDYGSGLAGGDVDGDGYSDVVFGAPGHSSSRGRVLWTSGRTRRTSQITVGSLAGGRFGTRVAVAHLDAVANPDIVVSGKDLLTAYSSSGWRKLWSVKPIANVNIEALDTIGDVNRDGYDDLVAGLPTYNGNRGGFRVVSGKDGRTLYGGNGANIGDRSGETVAGLGGDIDSDLTPDFVVGHPGYASNGGLVSYHAGNGGARLGSPLLGRAGQRLGRALSRIGDVDGDRWVDTLIGFVGGCQVVSRGRTVFYKTGGSTFGHAVAGLDTNGDCKPDVVTIEHGKAIWIWDGVPKTNPPQVTVYGTTCPDSKGRLARAFATPKPRLGGTTRMTLSAAAPNSVTLFVLAAQRLSLNLTAARMPGCFLNANPFLWDSAPVNSLGRAEIRLPISSNPAFLGAPLIMQWLPIDLGLPRTRLRLTASDAVELRIGAK